MTDLFDTAPPDERQPVFQPLADRMRPVSLERIRGQDHLLGEGKPLRTLLGAGKCSSMIFWGPPGCGKTTLARVIARLADAEFIPLSAVTSGVKELKEACERARVSRTHHGRNTILFIDEIHRYNKGQQDALLPHIESGTVILIGATTENPSFEIVSALLSRCQVLVLNPLTPESVRTLLDDAVGGDPQLTREPRPAWEPEALDRIAALAAGDARIALNVLETCCEVARQHDPYHPRIDQALVGEVFQNKALRYDKGGEEHYNLISALHKSLRGSDPDAGLYWLYRMLEGGENPRFILRRMIRFASEDIGMADPFALTLAMSAAQAFEYLGPPEAHLALAHLAVYLAAAPKSNALYMAEKRVIDQVRAGGEPGVPLHLRNAPTRLMKNLDYGKEYRYPHDFPGGFLRETYFPEGVPAQAFYRPKPIGREKATLDRLKTLWPERYRPDGEDRG
ncbi:MAG: replication-associated recombination protein A [Candidatus Riflebacteria bacterium]|nr:replication-associated recombination protein A [Candidatus Riflebacteria bacterium]